MGCLQGFGPSVFSRSPVRSPKHLFSQCLQQSFSLLNPSHSLCLLPFPLELQFSSPLFRAFWCVRICIMFLSCFSASLHCPVSSPSYRGNFCSPWERFSQRHWQRLCSHRKWALRPLTQNLLAGLESNLLNKLTFVKCFFPLLPEKYFLQKIDWFGSHVMYTDRQGFKVEGAFSWTPEMIANWWEIWRKVAELVHSLSLKLKEFMCLCISIPLAFTHLCVCVLYVPVYVWCLCLCVNACEEVCGWWYGTWVCWVGCGTCMCVCECGYGVHIYVFWLVLYQHNISKSHLSRGSLNWKYTF